MSAHLRQMWRRTASRTYYHVSPRRNRASILEHGLRLSDVDGRHIWLFSDLAMAQESAKRSWGGSRGDNDIWQVDVSGAEVLPDPHLGWGDERDEVAHVITEVVPPHRLHLVTASKTASSRTASAITYEVVPTWLEDWPQVVARDGDRIVGRLSFHRRWGKVPKVMVDPAYRRRGIATRMAEVAKEHGTFEEFSFAGGDYSEEGAAWATTMRGRDVYPTWASPADFTKWMLGSKMAIAKQVWYRVSDRSPLADIGRADDYIHLGTDKAARRAIQSMMKHGDQTLYRVDIVPRNPMPGVQSEDVQSAITMTLKWRREGWGEWPTDQTRTLLEQAGWDPAYDAVFYTNDIEDPGSISVMVKQSVITSVEAIEVTADRGYEWSLAMRRRQT